MTFAEWIQWVANGNKLVASCTALISGLISVAVGLILTGKLVHFWWRFSRHRYPRTAAFAVQSVEEEGVFDYQFLEETPRYSLTIVIPAYREEARLPPMLRACLNYLRSRHNRDPEFTAEVIVVDDGSPDGTAQVAVEEGRMGMIPGKVDVKLIKFPQNQGKGAAVCEGILAALGDRILFADADGSTRISDMERLEKAINQNAAGLACGSRSVQQALKTKVKRSPLRCLLMHAFHAFIGLFGVRGINDTQCGFKMLTRQCARACLPQMHLDGWIFDCELILMCQWLGYRVVEVPVNWEERDGSKLNVAFDSVRMALDLIFMRLAYGLGLWRVPPTATKKFKLK